MNAEQAVTIQRFLSRVDLKGSEVPAFVEVMNVLQNFITPQEGIQEQTNQKKEVVANGNNA